MTYVVLLKFIPEQWRLPLETVRRHALIPSGRAVHVALQVALMRKLSVQYLAAMTTAVAMLAACSSTYYRALESFGIEKRDILVDRIEEAREAQTDAKDQFVSALDQYRSVVTVDGGDLEKTYDRLNRTLERSETRAQVVRDRIDAVESVAGDLFVEWQGELDDYANPGLRRRSESLLTDTRQHYGRLLQAMHRAEGSMDPVLTLFGDQVLFLRHNLNARSIAALESELGDIERATSTLIADMQRSIDEAGAFIDAMAP